jgi:hypothetical protein
MATTGRLWPDRRPTTESLEPGISHIDVSLRSLTWPHIPRQFTRQSHLASVTAPNRLLPRLGSAVRVGSIPIARSTSFSDDRQRETTSANLNGRFSPAFGGTKAVYAVTPSRLTLASNGLYGHWTHMRSHVKRLALVLRVHGSRAHPLRVRRVAEEPFASGLGSPGASSPNSRAARFSRLRRAENIS